MQNIRRWLVRLFLAMTSIVVAITVTAWLLMRQSLPVLSGDLAVAGLQGAVTIARDDAGIPVITASTRNDLAFATGFVHAQERFFQMDLSRRRSAGELAAMFGERALALDRETRLHRFRSRAQVAVQGLADEEAAVLAAYVDGVNAGLSSLRAKPFEYWLLRSEPQPWRAEDSILVAYSMFLTLNDERASRDVARGLAAQVLPAAVFDWMYPDGTAWDAPLDGAARSMTPIPDAEIFTLTSPAPATAQLPQNHDALLPGSNNWAIAGALTASGRALVANDMHLGINVPNVFYRARLVVTGSEARDLNGVTLPGAPVIVAGSNGHVAWGNTNSYGDWSDAVIVRAGSTPGSYLTPDGEAQFSVITEKIVVNGSDDQELVIRETKWGPVLDDDSDPERMLAVAWIAHHAEAINLGQLPLESATNVEEAIYYATRCGMPPQNFVVGDAAGNIAWTIAGRIPRRGDYDASLPADWSEQEGWTGWLDPDEHPRIINPPSGRIWTANARVVDGRQLELIGDGGYDFGARAMQIRDALLGKTEFAPADMLAVQLDDRALFLERWRTLLLQTLDDTAVDHDDARAQYRKLVDNWVPRASIESVGYRLVRAFRQEVRLRVFNMLMQPAYARYGDEVSLRISNQFEGPLWQLLTERPRHMLGPEYADWHALLLAAVDANIDYYRENYAGGLEARTWGERNTAIVQHPLGRSLPLLGDWLNMPAVPLPGDSNLPRAQGPTFGASERFGVSPGDEAQGYLHMPVGQSGHPLSDFYANAHEDWIHGRPTPFLPGAARFALTLSPARP